MVLQSKLHQPLRAQRTSNGYPGLSGRVRSAVLRPRLPGGELEDWAPGKLRRNGEVEEHCNVEYGEQENIYGMAIHSRSGSIF